METTVWLLGAGASKSYTDSPCGQRMPISRDFFRIWRELPIQDHPWVLQDALMAYVLREKNADPEAYLQSGIDIEELHSEIAERLWQAYPDSPQDAIFNFWKPYNELIFIFNCAINTIQNGPASKCHARIASLLKPSDVVITFNWDTLMDRALAENTAWRPDWGYSVIPKKLFRDSWMTPTSAPSTTCPLLLKLHGSTNWITSYPIIEAGQVTLTQASSPDTLYVYEHTTRPYTTYAGRYMDGYQPYSYGYYPPNILGERGKAIRKGHLLIRARLKVPWRPEGTTDHDGLVSMPIIIPPVKQKSYELFGSLFSAIWMRAQDALATARHIVVVGYSFPRTDHRSNRLFLDAFSGRASVPHVSILDPAPDRIQEKFLYEFGIPRDKLTVYRDRFSENFPLEKLARL